MKQVVLAEFSVIERMLPLTSGYLQAYASTDPVVRGDYDFVHYNRTANTPARTVVRDLVDLDADVYAFSCYVWNMGLIGSILPALREARPGAQVLLGGPQVMGRASSYLPADDESMAICNGEGEITFTEYLRALTESDPRLDEVAGLSFHRSGELVTTPDRPRISNLDEIPSPFLTGVFPSGHGMAVLETNRGCPYNCGFCYWGAATNDRIYRFSEDRIRAEIDWIARNEVVYLFIADANWGILKRDVTLTEHIAECALEFGAPQMVAFSSAKNKPDRVTRIAEILQDAGLVTSQPVSLQTLEPKSLELVSRSNIKLSAFLAVQQNLTEKGISSYVELIWPLPGETLDSFKWGIGELCDNEAHTLIAYPLLLLNNTPMYDERHALGLKTRAAKEGAAEALIVIATNEVSEDAFSDGMRFFYAVHALHNTRSLRAVGRYLAASSDDAYADLFSDFATFLRRQPGDDPISSFVEESLLDAGYFDASNYGTFIHHTLHANRAGFGALLRQFVEQQPWWSDETARALFEIDRVNRPYVYGNTAMDPLDGMETLGLVAQSERSYTVTVPEEHWSMLADVVLLAGEPTDGTFVVDHRRTQYPFMPSQSMDHNGNYCYSMVEKIGNIMPTWRPVQPHR